jgi:hypothetical protein
MALDMFLTLDGIAGESTDPVHKGAIEISSWSWGLSEPASMASAGAGAGVGKVAIQNIVVHKNVDIASPPLIRHCAQGDRIASGTVSVRKAGGGGRGGVGRSTDRNRDPCFRQIRVRLFYALGDRRPWPARVGQLGRCRRQNSLGVRGASRSRSEMEIARPPRA